MASWFSAILDIYVGDRGYIYIYIYVYIGVIIGVILGVILGLYRGYIISFRFGWLFWS